MQGDEWVEWWKKHRLGTFREDVGLKKIEKGVQGRISETRQAQWCRGSGSFSSASAINLHTHSVIFSCPACFWVYLLDYKPNPAENHLCLSVSCYFSASCSPYLSLSHFLSQSKTVKEDFPRDIPEERNPPECCGKETILFLAAQDTNKIKLKVMLVVYPTFQTFPTHSASREAEHY